MLGMLYVCRSFIHFYKISGKINDCSFLRGRNYLKNGQKVPSGETMFSLLGADNIMKKKPHDNYRARDVSKSPDSYFAKLTSASKVLGLKPPFL